MTQPASQPYAQQPAPSNDQAASPSMSAKIKAQIPLTIGVVCFLFVIFYGFIGGAFDIDDRDIRRFLRTAGVCAAASGFLSLLIAAFTRTIDRENAPGTIGPALLCIGLLIMLGTSMGMLFGFR